MPDQTNLSFDPETLSGATNEDGTPFFSEEHLAKLPNLAKFKGEKGQALMAKSLMELEGMKGMTDKTLGQLKADKEAYEKEVGTRYEGHLSPPKKDATDEEKAEYAARVKKFMGVPETVDGYELKVEGPVDEDSVSALKQLAFEHNWTPEATQKALDIHQALVARAGEAHDSAQVESARVCEKILTELWGGKKNYVEACENIKRALRERVNPDFRLMDVDMDEAWQEFSNQVYASGVGNNHVIMSLCKDALDAGILGRVEGKTLVEMHGSVPVQKGQTWAELNPGIPEP